MFNMYVTVPSRTSSAVESLQVDLLKQKVRCIFKDGRGYEYKNVSKRAIANVLFNPDISLGFWANNNLLKSERAYEVGNTTNVTRTRLERALAGPQLPALA